MAVVTKSDQDAVRLLRKRLQFEDCGFGHVGPDTGRDPLPATEEEVTAFIKRRTQLFMALPAMHLERPPAVASTHLTEAGARALRTRARELGDELSAQQWSRFIWKHWAADRYVARFGGDSLLRPVP